jgi:hypothetical protein
MELHDAHKLNGKYFSVPWPRSCFGVAFMICVETTRYPREYHQQDQATPNQYGVHVVVA